MRTRVKTLEYKKKNELGAGERELEDQRSPAGSVLCSLLRCDSHRGPLSRGKVRYLQGTEYNVLSVLPGAHLGEQFGLR